MTLSVTIGLKVQRQLENAVKLSELTPVADVAKPKRKQLKKQHILPQLSKQLPQPVPHPVRKPTVNTVQFVRTFLSPPQLFLHSATIW